MPRNAALAIRVADDPLAAPRAFPVVCIGMSSGGMNPLKSLVRELSPEIGMAFVIIHHMHLRSVPTLLPQILSQSSNLPVELASAGKSIEPNHIYVLPPGREMTIKDGYFSLRARSKPKGWPNVITIFLQSLARSAHIGIAVILSGYGKDGAEALTLLQKAGGITIVQAPQTAEVSDMPSAAVETGCANYILPPDEISVQLEKIANDLKG